MSSSVSGGGSLSASLRIQSRVVFALLMRESLTRFGRHNIGFLWLFVEPMIFTLGVTALWTAMNAFHGSTIPITIFALTGYSSVLLWRNMPARCINAIEPNLALMFHRNVKPSDVYLARLILEGMGATISFIFLAAFFMFIGWVKPPEDILKVLAGWMLLAWFGMSLALFLGVLSDRTELVEKLWHPASYLLFPLSGAAFLVEALPEVAQDVLLVLPMIHGVELVRDGYFGSQFKAVYDVPYMVFANGILTLFGLAELRKMGERLTPQ